MRGSKTEIKGSTPQHDEALRGIRELYAPGPLQVPITYALLQRFSDEISLLYPKQVLLSEQWYQSDDGQTWLGRITVIRGSKDYHFLFPRLYSPQEEASGEGRRVELFVEDGGDCSPKTLHAVVGYVRSCCIHVIKEARRAQRAAR